MSITIMFNCRTTVYIACTGTNSLFNTPETVARGTSNSTSSSLEPLNGPYPSKLFSDILAANFPQQPSNAELVTAFMICVNSETQGVSVWMLSVFLLAFRQQTFSSSQPETVRIGHNLHCHYHCARCKEYCVAAHHLIRTLSRSLMHGHWPAPCKTYSCLPCFGASPPSTSAMLYCLVTEAQACEQLTQGRT